MKRTAAIVVLVLVALAYVAGFWPQYRRLTDARAQLQETQNRLAAADGRIRLADRAGSVAETLGRGRREELRRGRDIVVVVFRQCPH